MLQNAKTQLQRKSCVVNLFDQCALLHIPALIFDGKEMEVSEFVRNMKKTVGNHWSGVS